MRLGNSKVALDAHWACFMCHDHFKCEISHMPSVISRSKLCQLIVSVLLCLRKFRKEGYSSISKTLTYI